MSSSPLFTSLNTMKALVSELRPAIAATLVLAAVTCGAYPLLVTDIAQTAFKNQAAGSLITDKDGKVIGSALLGQNFAADQFVGMGTCPSFDSRSTFYYKTPDLGGGFSVALSFMPTFGQDVKSGEAEEDASIALVYAATAADGAKWTASTGFERVLEVKGGGPTSDSWQAGVNRAKAGWTIGAAAAMTTFDQHAGKESALGIGVVRDLTDRWQASLGANWSNSTYDGADLTETSVALIASYSVIVKRLAVNFGLWQVETEDQGTTVQDTRLGTGLTFSF